MRNICSILTLTLLGCAGSTPKETPKEEAPPASSIKTEEVEYAVDGVKMTGYLAWDSAKEGKRPGVLVVHEWWGHDDYARKRAHQLAEMGYTGFALDMYGDGKKADHPDDAKKFMMEVMSNMEGGMARFDAARRILESHESTDDRSAAIGYCFGGAIVLHMARHGATLRGVASFHGNLGTEKPAEADAVRSKILVLHGADDPFVPAEQVEQFKAEMQAANADMRFIAYPGALHSFTNPAATKRGEALNLPLKYDEDADKKSWGELTTFLEAVFE